MPAEVDMELGGGEGGGERESLGSQSEGSMGSLQRLPYQPGNYVWDNCVVLSRGCRPLRYSGKLSREKTFRNFAD